jgi:hypothetical protein
MRPYTILGSFALSLGALSVVALSLPLQAQTDIQARDAPLLKRATINMLGLPCNITCISSSSPLPPVNDCIGLFNEISNEDSVQEVIITPSLDTGYFPTHPLNYDTTLTTV